MTDYVKRLKNTAAITGKWWLHNACTENRLTPEHIELAKYLRDELDVTEPFILAIAGAMEDSNLKSVTEIAIMHLDGVL